MARPPVNPVFILSLRQLKLLSARAPVRLIAAILLAIGGYLFSKIKV